MSRLMVFFLWRHVWKLFGPWWCVWPIWNGRFEAVSSDLDCCEKVRLEAGMSRLDLDTLFDAFRSGSELGCLV